MLKLGGLFTADLSTERWLKVQTTTRFVNSQVHAWWLNKKSTCHWCTVPATVLV